MDLQRFNTRTLGLEQMRQIAEVRWKVWSDREPEWTDYIDIIRRRMDREPDSRYFLLSDGGQLLAHARVFSREIAGGGETFRVLALASVFTDPEQQGLGYGRQVVEAAFGILPDSGCRCSLFQTPVPGFYSRLGCETVNNPFINSLNREHPEANPWWDGDIMIYPRGTDWPQGIIDLQGPAW